jgi:hypothetical protein
LKEQSQEATSSKQQLESQIQNLRQVENEVESLKNSLEMMKRSEEGLRNEVHEKENTIGENMKEMTMMRKKVADAEQNTNRLELSNRRIKDLENLVQIQQQEKKKEREKDIEVSKICVQLHGALAVDNSENLNIDDITGSSLQQLWRISEEVIVEIEQNRRKEKHMIEQKQQLRRERDDMSRKLAEAQEKYDNSGIFAGVKNTLGAVTGVCKRRKQRDPKFEENAMSMFHDEIEDL